MGSERERECVCVSVYVCVCCGEHTSGKRGLADKSREDDSFSPQNPF